MKSTISNTVLMNYKFGYLLMIDDIIAEFSSCHPNI